MLGLVPGSVFISSAVDCLCRTAVLVLMFVIGLLLAFRTNAAHSAPASDYRVQHLAQGHAAGGQVGGLSSAIYSRWNELARRSKRTTLLNPGYPGVLPGNPLGDAG